MSKMLAEDLLKIGVFDDDWKPQNIPLELSRFKFLIYKIKKARTLFLVLMKKYIDFPRGLA